MQIGVLGPLSVEIDDGAIDVPGTRLRTLLTRLAMDAGRPVDTTALVEAVWGDSAPADEANALQSLVSRLRRVLGDAGAVRASAGGYLLAVAPEDVDVERFTRLAREGSQALRAGRPDRAVEVLEEAVGLWRGPPLADAAGAQFADAAATRLDDLWVRAATDRLEALLALGAASRAVADLEALAARQPLDERIAALLMTALADQGRQADALAAYTRIRDELATSLGVDPGAALRDAHLRVLRGEPMQTTEPTPDRSVRRTNLRAPVSSFVGREFDLGRLGEVLDAHRLVTLVGPGGAGKTRLATEAMSARLGDAADGVWVVELAPVTDPDAVAQTVLGALDLRESAMLDRARTAAPSLHPDERLVEALADRDVVLVFDNCEHLVDAAARLADHLLAHCPGLRILATSREPLGIVGEVLVGVAPLPPPDSAEPAEAMRSPAVRLFLDRAAAVRRDGPLGAEDLPTVVDIVQRLDGLPLAIELAAARLRGLPLAEVAARLDDRFRLLTGGSRTALPRHRTLRAVVEWSWDLLSEPEQVLLERLAVFPAGATPESAAAVGAGDAVRSDDVVDLLASLVDKSLLQQHAGSAGVRFRMLETIREFGLERLAARGELAGRRVVFAGWFADLVSRSEPALHGPDQLDHLRVLRDERDNVVAALGVCCDAGDAAGALAIAVPSASLAMQLGNHAEAVGWLNAALATPGESDPALRAVAVALRGVHSAASDFVYERGHDHDALLDEAAAALEGEGVTAYQMGAILRPVVAMFRRDPALPRILEEALASEDPWVSAVARILRSGVAENSGDPEGMRRDAEIALAQFRVLGDRWGTSEALCALAQQHVFTGDYDRAAEEYDEAIALIREMGSTEDEARALIWLADLRVRQGDMSAARAAVGEAVELTDGAGSAMVRTITLAMQAHVERLTGDLPRARELQRELSARLGRLPRAPAPMRHAEAMARGFSAQIDLAAGDVAAAREGVEHAWTAALGTADMPILAGVGVAVADVLAAVGGHDLAGEVLGATSAIRGVPDPSGADIARLAAALRAQLGDASASASIARGEALDRQAAIDRISRAIEEIRGAPALVVASDPAPVGGQG